MQIKNWASDGKQRKGRKTDGARARQVRKTQRRLSQTLKGGAV